MSSSSQPTSPSQRNPLTLLSKLKRQLSKPPITQHQKQPIEHQYLPIPTVSFSESVHSNRALSTYSCSNSSHSTFVLIDHNEQPASVGADEYRPFLPLIIQHERLQQQRLVPPRLAPSTAHRARTLPPPPNEPPSPTSTASSKSPVTPIFPSSFFDEDEDGIMTMTNSEVGSISEYSLPRSLSAYMDEARNRRGMKSDCQTSSDSGSRHRRCRGMSVRVSLFCCISIHLSITFLYRRLLHVLYQGNRFLQFLHRLHVLYLNLLYPSNQLSLQLDLKRHLVSRQTTSLCLSIPLGRGVYAMNQWRHHHCHCRCRH